MTRVVLLAILCATMAGCVINTHCLSREHCLDCVPWGLSPGCWFPKQ